MGVKSLYTMEVRISIVDSPNIGFEILKDGKTTKWDDLSKSEQIQVLYSFEAGKKLFSSFVKDLDN